MRRALAVTASLLVLAAAPAAADAAVRHVIRGAGFGHGIGMSQYGAYGYALHGAQVPGRSSPTTTRARGSRARPRGRCACCCSPSDPYIRVRGATRIGGRALEARPHLRRARVGRRDPGHAPPPASAWRAWATAPASADRDPLRLLGPALNGVTERPLPRRDRAAHRGLGHHRDQRARPRQLRARRGGRRDAQLLAARGAQGPGRGGAHVRARHAQDDRAVRPVPRHPLAGLPRRDRRERAQRRRRARHRRAASSPTAACPP